MDTNRILLSACIASLALCVTSAGAQTIYKQVDPEGRVMFTDQPNPDARIVASFETSRPARRPDTRSDQLGTEPVRTPSPGFSLRPITPALAEPGRSSEPGAERAGTRSAESLASASGRLPYEAERAARTYTPLVSPLASQVDANESARRTQQEVRKDKDPAAGVLIIKPLPREHVPTTPHSEGFTTFYVLWAATFFLLAAGLLYVGWQVLRLILRSASPAGRWESADRKICALSALAYDAAAPHSLPSRWGDIWRRVA